jgi:hypothetical protein
VFFLLANSGRAMRLHEITNAPGDCLPADSEVDEMIDELLQTLGKLSLMRPLIRQNNEQASTETGNGRPLKRRCG